MSATLEAKKPAGHTKKEGKGESQEKKGEQKTPQHAQKAQKWYPVVDERQPKKVHKAVRPAKLRPSLTPGTVLIILAGRFRGKRVILLRHISQGVLLVTGPFKINGVPLRRVNARYVIATSVKVDLKGIDEATVGKVASAGYFTRDKDNRRKKGEEAFFKQAEKPGKPEAKKPSSDRAKDQKTIDKALIANIKKETHLAQYLGSSFSLRNGDRPHEMKW